jgi:hypothetical protein
MVMESVIEYPVSGTEAAKLAWKISDSDFVHLVDSGTPNEFHEDIRSRFALWLSTQPRKIFPSMSVAWNIFVEPKLKFDFPVILLPNSICTTCSATKHRTKNFTRIGYDQCPQCKGTGRKPPRAVKATYDELQILTKVFAPSKPQLDKTMQTV